MEVTPLMNYKEDARIRFIHEFIDFGQSKPF